MEETKRKKIGVVAFSASVLTVGTVALAAAYQAGISFNPSGKERDIQTNQVVFSDDDTTNHTEDSGKKKVNFCKKIRTSRIIHHFEIRPTICLITKNN